MNIFNVGEKSVNRYLLVSDSHRLLIDTGFPDTLNSMGREMRNTGYKISEVDYLAVTHFHIDHAGAIQELKNQGVKFILFDFQQRFIEPMEILATGKWKYTPLKLTDNLVINTEDSGLFLRKLNINGKFIHTPGHSPDSVSLVLRTGETFTGDLPPESLLMEDDIEKKLSWEKLKSEGVSRVFPGHGNPYNIIY